MAKENKKFSKSSITVRAILLPAGDAPITGNVESMVSAMTESMNTGMASFYLGNGMYGKDANTFIAKSKSNKKSILGEKDSIYNLLNEIKLGIKNLKDVNLQTTKNTNTANQLLQNGIYFNNVPFLDLIYKQLLNLNKGIDEFINSNISSTTLDIDQLTKTLNQSISDAVDDAIGGKLANTEDIVKDIQSRIDEKIDADKKFSQILEKINIYEKTTDELFNIIKDLKEKKIEEISAARIQVAVEGLKDTTIDGLIKFAEMDLSKLDENSINLQKFFESLKTLEKLDIKETLASISLIAPLLTTVGLSLKPIQLINKLFTPALLEAIENIFGSTQKNKKQGILQKIIKSVNNLDDIKPEKLKSISKSLLSMSAIFGETMIMFGTLWPLAILYNKLLSNVNYIQIFEGLNKLTNQVIQTTTIDAQKIENIEDSIKGIRSIMKSLIVMNLTALMFGKKKEDKDRFGKVTDIFVSLDELFYYIKEIENSEKAKEKLVTINSSINDVNDILSQLVKMKLVTLVAKIGSFEKLAALFSAENSSSIQYLFNEINKVNNVTSPDLLKRMLEGFNSIEEIISILKKTKVDKQIQDNLNQLYSLFEVKNNDDKNVQKSLNTIFRALSSIQPASQGKLKDINTSLIGINTIIEILDDMAKKKIDIDKANENFEKYIETLANIYKKIDEKFKDIITTSNLVDQVKEANKKIEEGVDSCTETAVKTSSKEDDIKKGSISLEGLNSFMITATVVMSIGALFMMLGGGKFVKNALMFGVTLMAFETMVITPILLFHNIKSDALNGLNELSTFIITCTIMMSIGALFVMLGGGKFVENALAFGIVLGFFELLVIAPFLAFNKDKNNVFKGLSEFSGFLITCTIVMCIGALFMSLSGGKFVKNALLFGVVLGVFELLVITPFILFGLIGNKVEKGVQDFTIFLITCTTLMLIGALFMTLGGGKFVHGAIEFAKTLMIFEAMVIAPFLIMNLFKSQVFNGMKLLTVVMLTSTIILFIGTLFMANSKNVKNALKFTGLLMLFEIGVILPFILFNKVKNDVFKGLVSFTAVVLVCTTALLIGSLFMVMKGGVMPENAMLFTVLLMAFEAAVIAPILLFNLVKKDALSGAYELGIFIALCTGSLLVGALFISQFGYKPIAEYAFILGLFVGAMEVIAVGMSLWLNNKTLLQMEEFGTFILLSSASLIIGAMFMNKYGAGPVIGYGLCLLGFVLLMGAVMFGISFAFNAAGGIPMVAAEMAALGGFLFLATTSLILGAWFIETYGAISTLKYAGVLLLFTIGVGAVFTLLGVLSPAIALGSVVALAMGGALLILTTSLLLINGLFMLDPGGKNLGNNISTLNDVILGRLMWTFTLLGLFSVPIALGSVVALAIGASILVLGGSLELINLMMGEHGEQTKKNIEKLDEVIDMLKWTYTWLGLLSPIIVLGSAAAVTIGVSMAVLGSSFELINVLVGENGENLKKNVQTINDLLGWDYLASTYTLLGVLSPLIVLGSASAVALGVSMAVLGSSLFLIHTIVESTEGKLIEDIDHLSEVVGSLSLFCGKLILLSPLLLLGMAVTPLILGLSTGMFIATMAVYGSVKKMSEIGDIDKEVQTIQDNLKKFINIPDEVISVKDLIFKMPKLYAKLDAIRSIVRPMAETMLVTARAVQDMATLKVPEAWDKDGNPTKYRHLSEADFKLATDNTGVLLKTMALAFNKAWFGDNGNGGLQAMIENDDSAIWSTLMFGKEVGQVIKGIAEGVGAMAKMQVPIAWDEKGNPIGFRQLKERDFELASEGTQKILTNLVGTIIGVYALGGELGKTYNNGKNLFDTVVGGFLENDSPSPFMNTLEASLKIGELIANIGEGVANIAKMQIPIDWDEKGHVTRYRTLKPQDFTDMGTGISTILTSIITAIANLYVEGRPNGKLNQGVYDGNIFDAISHFWSSDEPSPFMQVLESSFRISELISNIGKGIKDIATMQIPDQWDEKGHAIHYQHLTSKDFGDAAKSIGDIICGVVNAVAGLSLENVNKAGTIFEQVKPVSELIANMSEGIVRLASGQIPINWDPKTGKPIEFRKITKDEYEEAGIVVGSIINHLAQVLEDIALDDTNEINAIFKDDTFKNIVESVSSLSGLINGIADSVIKIGQGLVPNAWDKDGKPTHYKPIDIDKASSDLKVTLDKIITASANAIIAVVKDPKNAGIFEKTEDSPLVNAVRSISDVTKIVSNITDSVIKIGSAMIPYEWDKDGKAIKYKHIDVNSAIGDIKKIFNGTNKEPGLLNVLCQVVYDTYNDWFNEDKNLSEKISPITNGMGQITKLVSNTADLVIKISSMKIPTGFDKEGKATGYQTLKDNDIQNAQQRIVTILNNIFGIQELVTEKDEQVITNWAGNITNNIQNIAGVINTVMNQIKLLNKYSKEMEDIFKTKTHSKITNENLTIGLIKDLYTVVLNFSELSTLFDPQKISIANQVIKFNTLENNIGNISSAIETVIFSVASLIHNAENSEVFNKLELLDENNPKYIPNIMQKVFSIYTSASNIILKDLLENQQFTQVALMDKLDVQIKNLINPINVSLATIFAGFDAINNLVNKMAQIDKDQLINQLTIVCAFYNEALSKISLLYDQLNNSNQNMASNNLLKLTVDIATIAKVLSTMFNGISQSYDSFYGNVINFENNISAIISQLNQSTNGFDLAIKTLKENIEVIKGIYDLEIKKDLFGKTIFDVITDDLKNFIYNGVNPFDSKVYHKFELLNMAINTIYDSINKQKNNSQAFKNNTVQLQNYIKTINTIDVNKVNSLTSLVRELNTLSSRMGNLDQLTHEIADNLSVVLKELVENLKESKETIESAEKIQERRHQLINKSISEIKSIMDTPVMVQVSAGTTENMGDDGNGGGNNTTDQNPSAQPTSGSHSTRTDNTEQGGNGTPKTTKGTGNPSRVSTNTRAGQK